MEELLYKESIDNFIKDQILSDNPSDETIEYWKSINDMIWKFVQNANPDKLQIVSEDDLYKLKCEKYRYVGSRYEQDLDELNKHLTPRYAYMYRNQTSKIGPVILRPQIKKEKNNGTK